MDKSLAIGLVICILLLFIFLNADSSYSSLNSAYCGTDSESTYYHMLIP